MLKNFTGSIFILISALMFGSYGLFSRALENYDVFYQTYVRCFIVVLILVVIGVVRKEFKKIDREDIKWFVVICAFTVFSIVPIVYAFRFLTLGTASFLFYGAFTVFTYIFGFLFFKEKLTVTKATVLILSVIGLLLIFTLNLSIVLIVPAILAIINGLASSGEVTFTKKISQKYSNIQIVTIIFLVIGITHVPISLLLGENQNVAMFTESFLPLFLFSLAAIIGMFTVVEGFKYVVPSIGAIIGLMEIVFSLLFGVIFFSEEVNINIIIGGALIIVAAALPSLVEIYQARLDVNKE